MATTDDTSGHRFAGRQFCAKSYNSHSFDRFLINVVDNNESQITSGNDPGANTGSIPIINTHRFDSTLAELLETLRLHAVIVDHDVLRLPLSVQTRSRLVSGYCDIDSRVKEMRLLLNPVDIAAAVELLEVMLHPHGPKNSP